MPTLPPSDGEVKEEVQIAFVHSRLDDAELTPIPFRIYCHFSRRGECFASADTIAKCCRVHRDSVWPAISELERRGMIASVHRPGRTTIYKVTPLSNWTNPAESKGRVNPAEKDGHVGNNLTETNGQPVAESKGRRWRKVRVDHLEESKGHKGNPSEGNPHTAILLKSLRAEVERAGVEEKEIFNGADPAVKSLLTTMALKAPQEIPLQEVKDFARKHFPNNWQQAEAWVEAWHAAKQRGKWQDKEGKPIARWDRNLIAYVNGCWRKDRGLK